MVSQEPNQINYQLGIQQLQQMFPTLDLEIITSVLENNDNKIEPSIDFLLQISSQQYETNNNIVNSVTKQTNNDNKISNSNDNQISIFKNINNEQKNIEKQIEVNKKIEEQKKKDYEDSVKKNKTIINKNSSLAESQVVKKEVKKKTIGSKMKSWVSNIFGGNKKENNKVATTTDLNNAHSKDYNDNEHYMKISNDEEE